MKKLLTVSALGAALAIGAVALATSGTPRDTEPVGSPPAPVTSSSPDTTAPSARTHAKRAAARQNVAIRFTATQGTRPVTCGTVLRGLGTTKATSRPLDLRFYVSNVRMVRRNGSSVKLKLTRNDQWNLTRGSQSVSLIDLENGTKGCVGDRRMNAVIRGTVPRGKYTGVTYTLGVPLALNHTDPTRTPAPLNVMAMGWSWQAGRKFAKIELAKPRIPARTGRDFLVHLGSTGCKGVPTGTNAMNCSAQNRGKVLFRSFSPSTERIALDLSTLTAGIDPTRDRGGAAGCMSGATDPECATVFRAAGINWSANGRGTGRVVGDGTSQRLFRVVR